MKKIMFSDKFGLTEAVLNGKKTMTRRLVGNSMTEYDIKAYQDGYTEVAWNASPYKIGEVVAIAQPYKDIADNNYFLEQCAANEESVSGMKYEKGWNNKLYVAAYYMPHQIRITDVKVERLQDISEEDCLKEGIQEYFPYIDRNPNDKVRTFQYLKDGKIRHRISPASLCFSYFIDDVCGKGTWESNPYVFAYTFERVK